jgi:nicotinate-nucleotide adenylyltransferase
LICLFGGTFDPVHYGHLHGATAVCDALELSEIRMVLSARPGHREVPAAPAADRWQMLCLACDEDPRLVADDRELNRDAPSYTVDTLAELRAEVGDAQLAWVLGSDAFADLPSWHRWTEVLGLTNLVILQRPEQIRESTGAPEGALSTVLQSVSREHGVDHRPDAACGQILFLPDEMPAVSASEVRAALAAGRPVTHLLPDRVATYISRHGLYGVLRDP